MALSLVLTFWLWSYAFSCAPSSDESEKNLVIPPDLYFRGIEQKLVATRITRPDYRFKILARLMGVADSLRAGEYIFQGAMTPYRVLLELQKGSMVQRPVTIPEGANLRQIADILGNQSWVNPDRFLAMARDPNFISELGIKAESLEGYLFPDTYFFERGGHNAGAIIGTMVAQMRTVLKETGAEKGQPEAGLDTHEILTLASIVEKETGQALERPLIARVFLNRLRKKMKLQTDPTVIYGIENFNGNLTRHDLRTPTPYNTYIIKGLPPGPIGSPGLAAIKAVINPAQGAYYYFVSKNDGSHYFSKSLAEHNQAVTKYQKRRKRRNKRSNK